MDRREFMRLTGMGAVVLGSSTIIGLDGVIGEKEGEYVEVDGIRIKKEVFEKAREITVPNYTPHSLVIIGEGGEKDEGLVRNANGFVLKDKYFTANHVYKNASKIGDGRLVVNGRVLELIGFDENRDVAAFQLPLDMRNHMNDHKFNSEVEIYEGQKVLMYGNPAGYFFDNAKGHFREGEVLDPDYKSERKKLNGLVFFECPIWGGDSGSPIFDASNGDVLGTAVRGGGRAAYFSPIKNYSKFFDVEEEQLTLPVN